jgi:hypothetical protein
MRIATMTKQLLDEVRTQPLDAASLDRLQTIDTQIIGELLTDLTPDLREELQRLALPITRHTEMSDAELRLAHAQLVGWLQGLLHTVQTAQTALPDPHTVAANDSTTVPTAPNLHDRPHDEPCRPTKPLPEDRVKHPRFHAHLVTCDRCALRRGVERSTRPRLRRVDVGRGGASAFGRCTNSPTPT